MSAESPISICGILRVFRIYDGGKPQQVREQKNLVVNYGLSSLSRFLGGNVGSPTVGGSGFSALDDLAITRMDLGVAPSPASPVITDTTGVTSLAYTPTLSVTYPNVYSVTFQGVVPQNEFDATVFTEEAVRMRNGLTFARTTFSETKTLAYGLLFTHTFTFSRV